MIALSSYREQRIYTADVPTWLLKLDYNVSITGYIQGQSVFNNNK